MKRGVLFTVAAVALLAVVGGSAYAQELAVVNVPFKFTFNKKVMEPGKYEVKISSDAVVTLTPAMGQAVVGEAMTRLGQHDTPIQVPTFIFDKLNDQYYLSEVWLPESDGYLLNNLKQPHQHHTIKGTKKG